MEEPLTLPPAEQLQAWLISLRLEGLLISSRYLTVGLKLWDQLDLPYMCNSKGEPDRKVKVWGDYQLGRGGKVGKFQARAAVANAVDQMAWGPRYTNWRYLVSPDFFIHRPVSLSKPDRDRRKIERRKRREAKRNECTNLNQS